ncbi:MAG TPA: selenocysteine-specific translation elongation factor [Clostridia bacterium]|nr:selenocysteine-specific translation elongation factor [Clostridia bacterium]
MSRFVVGTAGHIDHGKTTLIKALTGIPTDRLAEEQKRGISIVSGYAYLNYKEEKISIVDVPGHERFIKNMLAGVSGIDLVLLMVAADEGVMPQTREHFDILRLLGINRGLILMTKCDLADEEMQELVEMDIEELVEDTSFENFPILRVSAKSGEGLDSLKEYIFSEYEKSKEEPPYYPRLFIDRVFKGKGIGDIVTGTLEGADLAIDTPLALYPGQKDFNIRSIQSHEESTKLAQVHSRVALVLQGEDKDALEPGKALAPKDKYHETRSLIVKVEALKEVDERIKSGEEYKVYFGSDEFFAKLHAIKDNFYELELDRAMMAFFGQRGVLRQMSPVITLGGLEVLDSNPLMGKRNKLESVKHLTNNDFSSRLNYIGWKYSQGFTLEDLEREMVLQKEVLEEKIALEDIELMEQGKRFYTQDSLWRQQDELIRNLEKLCQSDPLKDYWDKEVLRSRYYRQMDRSLFEEMLKKAHEEEKITLSGNKVKPFSYKLVLSEEQLGIKEKILKKFDIKSYEIPTLSEVKSKLGKEELALLEYLIHNGELISINSEYFMKKDMVYCLKNDIIELGLGNRYIEIADVREALGLTRKYILPYLEYFDRTGVTQRVENARILTKEYENG